MKYLKLYESINGDDKQLLVDYFKKHSDKEYFYDNKTWKFTFKCDKIFTFTDEKGFSIFATPFFAYDDSIPVEITGGDKCIFYQPIKMPQNDKEREEFFNWYFTKFIPNTIYRINYPEFFPVKESIDRDEDIVNKMDIARNYLIDNAGREQDYKGWEYKVEWNVILFEKSPIKLYCTPFWDYTPEIYFQYNDEYFWRVPIKTPKTNKELEKFFNEYFKKVYKNLDICDNFLKLPKLIKLIFKVEKVDKLELNMVIDDKFVTYITEDEVKIGEHTYKLTSWLDTFDNFLILSKLYEHLKKEYGNLEEFFPIKESLKSDSERKQNIKKLLDYFESNYKKDVIEDWNFDIRINWIGNTVFVFEKPFSKIYATPFFVEYKDEIPIDLWREGFPNRDWKEPAELPTTDEERKKFYDWYFETFIPNILYKIDYPDFFPTKESIKLNIDIGDTLLGGKFKNKQVVVKEIDKDENGQIIINGKPLLKFRIWKNLPKRMKDKYKLKNKD